MVRSLRREVIDGQNYTCLNVDHTMCLAKDIHASDLRHHLIMDHNVSVTKARTKGQLGRLHLLAHAVMAHPDLRRLMHLPERWGQN